MVVGNSSSTVSTSSACIGLAGMTGASVWGRREGINLVARNSRIVEAIERYLEKTSSFCFVFLIGKNKNVTVLYVIVVAIIDLILLEML